jgi:hypothetical protein
MEGVCVYLFYLYGVMNDRFTKCACMSCYASTLFVCCDGEGARCPFIYLHSNGGGVGDHKLKIIRLPLLGIYFNGKRSCILGFVSNIPFLIGVQTTFGTPHVTWQVQQFKY